MRNPNFLSFTLKYLKTYGSKIVGMYSYEPLDIIHECKWSYSDSEQWNFAVDYVGKGRITNIGIFSKPKIGSGLLYDNRGFVRLITLLDNHKWEIRQEK